MKTPRFSVLLLLSAVLPVVMQAQTFTAARPTVCEASAGCPIQAPLGWARATDSRIRH